MTDIGNMSGMQHASMHAGSTSPNPTLHEYNYSQSSSSSQNSKAVDLSASTNDVSRSDLNPPTTRTLTPPLSEVSTQGTKDANGVQFSVQGRDSDFTQSHDDSKQIQVVEENKSQNSPGRESRESSTGIKRSANGQIKASNTPPSIDLKTDGNTLHHSHPVNNHSSGVPENMMEISQQLRTKLAYAMVKVQNGWQTRSLDEVESLASQSPKSTLSGFPNARTPISPRVIMSQKLHRKWSDSDSSDNANLTKAPTEDDRPSSHGSTRGLAPAAKIVSGSKAKHNANGLHTSNVTMQSFFPQPSLSRPRPRPRPNQTRRTTSQNAAMEADAVETLLFMASPNNSGYFPSQSSSSQQSRDNTSRSKTQPQPQQPPHLLSGLQTSPLRTQFSQTFVSSPKTVVNHQRHQGISSGGLSPTSPSSSLLSIDKSAQIDRLLDTLSDESEDELEQEEDEAFGLVNRNQSLKVSV